MNIKNIFALVIVSVLSNICLAGDFNITCKGENYSKTNITNLETNDGTEIRTFRIILNKINNMQNCPIANENQAFCMFTSQMPGGVILNYSVNIDRVSGYAEEITITDIPRENVIKDMPNFVPYLGNLSRFKITKTFKSFCIKSDKNKF
jgi:hypothetical protein